MLLIHRLSRFVAEFCGKHQPRSADSTTVFRGGLKQGIAADDFQNPSFGQAFTATINGTTDSALTAHLNATDETGPRVQFFTVGIPLSELSSSNVLTLSINEGGDGGDGWAVDFLTVGVNTTSSTASAPEPSSLGLFAAAGLSGLWFIRRRKA